MPKGQSLQEPFLNALREKNTRIHLSCQWIKLQGQIESFDQFVILLKNGVNQMIYKSAISTVVPSRALRFPYPISLPMMPMIRSFQRAYSVVF